MWKLDYFSQNIWRGQIGLGTRIFDQFWHFDNLQPFTYLSQKFEVWGSWYENWSLLARLFEGVTLVLEPQFLVSFCILMIYKHLLTCDKNFQLEAHDMKIDLFLADFERSDWFRNLNFRSFFAFFRPATIYQPMIKNLNLRLMTRNWVFFLGTSLVSAGCRNRSKPYRSPDFNYWRDGKDI